MNESDFHISECSSEFLRTSEPNFQHLKSQHTGISMAVTRTFSMRKRGQEKNDNTLVVGGSDGKFSKNLLSYP